MRITAHLHTILQRQTPDGLVRRLEVDLPGGSRLADLLAILEITLPMDALLLAVNGRVAGPGQILEEGDQVNIMPAISGGSYLIDEVDCFASCSCDPKRKSVSFSV